MNEKNKQQQRDRTLALQRLRRLARDRSPFLRMHLRNFEKGGKVQLQFNF